jgi:hypothetical protein
VRRLFLDSNVLFTAAHNPKGKAAFLFELGVEDIGNCVRAPMRRKRHGEMSAKFPSLSAGWKH